MKAIILVLVAALSGCSYEIMTPDVAVTAPAPVGKGLAIGAVSAGLETAEAPAANADARRDFYATLTSESHGVVSEYARQPLQLLASLNYKITSDPPGAFIGVLSCYLPPLGFIPYDSSENYSVAYSLRDREGRVVYSRSLDSTVGGSIKGWFVGRITAQDDLHKLEAPFVAKNAARLVIQDVFANAGAIADAARAMAGEASAAPLDGAQPAAGDSAAWWSK